MPNRKKQPSDIVDDIKSEREQRHELVALSEVAFGTQHALNVLLDLLIAKGVVSEQEFRDKLDEMVEQSPDVEDVSVHFSDNNPEE